MKRILLITVALLTFGLTACESEKSTITKELDTSEGQVTIMLPQSLEADQTFKVTIPSLSWEWTGYLHFRNYGTDEEWSSTLFWVDENQLMVSEPELPTPPTKGTTIEYYIKLTNASTNERFRVPSTDAVVLEFK